MEKTESLQQCWENMTATCKTMKFKCSPIPYTKTYIKINYLKNLHVRHDTIKLLKENRSKILFDINPSDILLVS